MMTISIRFALVSGALMCASGILTGAFGSHAIANWVTATRLQTWQTAAHYLFTQGLGLLIIGTLSQVLNTPLKTPIYGIFAGSMIFSLSLFSLVLTNLSWLGALTPIGGLSMIISWLALAGLLYKHAQNLR